MHLIHYCPDERGRAGLAAHPPHAGALRRSQPDPRAADRRHGLVFKLQQPRDAGGIGCGLSLRPGTVGAGAGDVDGGERRGRATAS